MQRQHREGIHTGKERERLIGDLEVKNELHKYMSFTGGDAIQITELSLELKPVLLL